MEVKSQSNIKSQIFSKERVRSQSSSIMIVPKKSKESQNGQLQFTITNEELPLKYLLIAFQLIVSEWNELFERYPIYRAFVDSKPNKSTKLLISFNTPVKLTPDEREKVINLVLPKLIKLLDNLKEPLKNQESKIEFLTTEIEERREMLEKLISIKDTQELNFERNIKKTIKSLKNRVILHERLSTNLKKVSEELTLDNNELTLENELKDKRIKQLEESLLTSKNGWNSDREIYSNKILELNKKFSESEKDYLSKRTQSSKRISTLEKDLNQIKSQLLNEEKENKKKISKLSNQTLEYKEMISELNTNLEEFRTQLIYQEELNSKQYLEFNRRENELLTGLDNEKIKNVEELQKLNTNFKISSEQLCLEGEIHEEKILKLEKRLEKANEQLEFKEKNFEEQQNELEQELEATMSELEVVKEENKKKTADLNKLIEESVQSMIPTDLKSEVKINGLEQAVEVPVKVNLNNTMLKHDSEFNFSSIQSSWDELFQEANKNYQQLNMNLDGNPQKIDTSKFKPIDIENNRSEVLEKVEKISANIKKLSKIEEELRESFLDYDLSHINNKVSCSAKEFKNYIYNVSFLKLRWQKVLDVYTLPKNKLFISTFKPYVEDVEKFLDKLTTQTKNNFLNKEKVLIKKYDLNLLKAYNNLSNYLN